MLSIIQTRYCDKRFFIPKHIRYSEYEGNKTWQDWRNRGRRRWREGQIRREFDPHKLPKYTFGLRLIRIDHYCFIGRKGTLWSKGNSPRASGIYGRRNILKIDYFETSVAVFSSQSRNIKSDLGHLNREIRTVLHSIEIRFRDSLINFMTFITSVTDA